MQEVDVVEHDRRAQVGGRAQHSPRATPGRRGQRLVQAGGRGVEVAQVVGRRTAAPSPRACGSAGRARCSVLSTRMSRPPGLPGRRSRATEAWRAEVQVRRWRPSAADLVGGADAGRRRLRTASMTSAPASARTRAVSRRDARVGAGDDGARAAEVDAFDDLTRRGTCPKRRFNGHNPETASPLSNPGQAAKRPPGPAAPPRSARRPRGAAPPGAAGTTSSTPVRSRPPRVDRRGLGPALRRPAVTEQGAVGAGVGEPARATGTADAGDPLPPPEAAPASSRTRWFTKAGRPCSDHVRRPRPPRRGRGLRSPTRSRAGADIRKVDRRPGDQRPLPRPGLLQRAQNSSLIAERSSFNPGA